MPYWSIILLDCLVILFSGLLVYALNNGIFATMGIFGTCRSRGVFA